MTNDIAEVSEIDAESGTWTLLRFNPRRAARGVPAAEVKIESRGNEVVLWMTRREIEANIRDFGPHAGLLAALAAYIRGEEIR